MEDISGGRRHPSAGAAARGRAAAGQPQQPGGAWPPRSRPRGAAAGPGQARCLLLIVTLHSGRKPDHDLNPTLTVDLILSDPGQGWKPARLPTTLSLQSNRVGSNSLHSVQSNRSSVPLPHERVLSAWSLVR